VPISGLETIDGSIVFHAGTSRAGDKVGKTASRGEIVTAGGRVLAVTSMAATMDEALAASYATLSKISFDNIYYRKDIGKDR
jgi:phosphoribosylamine--glycine ligase